MALNIKQIADWLNEAQQDVNRPMGQPSKTGAYAKFTANAMPIVYTLLKKIEQLKSEANRRDSDLLEKVEKLPKHYCEISNDRGSVEKDDIIKLIKGE